MGQPCEFYLGGADGLCTAGGRPRRDARVRRRPQGLRQGSPPSKHSPCSIPLHLLSSSPLGSPSSTLDSLILALPPPSPFFLSRPSSLLQILAMWKEDPASPFPTDAADGRAAAAAGAGVRRRGRRAHPTARPPPPILAFRNPPPNKLGPLVWRGREVLRGASRGGPQARPRAPRTPVRAGARAHPERAAAHGAGVRQQ